MNESHSSEGDFTCVGTLTLRAPAVAQRPKRALVITEGGTDVGVEPRSVNRPVFARGTAGAILYGGLGFLSFEVPSAANTSSLLALAIIPFFGIQFGAVAGFLTGALGNALLEQLHGGGLTLFWNWTIADGLVGMMAGLMGSRIRQRIAESHPGRSHRCLSRRGWLDLHNHRRADGQRVSRLAVDVLSSGGGGQCGRGVVVRASAESGLA